MKTKEKRLKINIIFGAVVGLVGIACGLWLLISLEKISGAEFVALVLGFSVIGLIIAFAAEVQEFSIAGNGVKLKELRSEAEKTIDELKEARTELFRVLVQKSIFISGGFCSNSIIDECAESFFELVEQIEKFNCLNDLKLDIEKSLKLILSRQYNNLYAIHKSNKKYTDPLESYDSPRILRMKISDESIQTYIAKQSPKLTTEEGRSVVNDALEVYEKLYAIKVKLDKLETDNA
ncbi:hypothetical protein D3C78_47980 [compost metagenome]